MSSLKDNSSNNSSRLTPLLVVTVVVVSAAVVMVMVAWSGTRSTNLAVLFEKSEIISGFDGPGWF